MVINFLPLFLGFQIRTVRVGQLGFSTGMANTLENENVELLPGSNDHYGGVMVDMKEQMDPTKFGSLLRSSMFHWRKQVSLFVCCYPVMKMNKHD